MGNLNSSRRVPSRDAEINTEFSFEFTQKVVLKELSDLGCKLTEIESRLFRTENATDTALRQLEEQNACGVKLIETYRKLIHDIKSEKNIVIEQLENEISILKQGKAKQGQIKQESELSLDKTSDSTFV